MRTIYIDEEPIRVETGCGLRPLHKCPVQVWAKQNGITCTMSRAVPWKPEIFLWTEDDHNKTFAEMVQNLCDSCYYGEAYKIKKNLDNQR